MIIPIAPADAIRVALNGVSYFFSFIAGRTSEPTADAVATPDPVIAPKNVLVITPTIPRPPVIQPIIESARSISLLAMPPAPMITPARIKNGIANNVKEFRPVKQF